MLPEKEEPESVVLKNNYLKAMDRLVSDPSFRQRLETKPVETLQEIGVEITPAAKAKLVGKRLSELLPGRVSPGGEVAHTGVLVVVGVAIGTNLIVEELDNSEVYRKQVQNRVGAVLRKKQRGK